jgi:Na+/melibiose symporter-like transporter
MEGVPKKIRRGGRMLSYAIGNMASSAPEINSLYYMNFLMFAMKLPPMLAGIVSSAATVWDGINDPLMGMIVDRTRTKWGSCRPWLLIAAPPVWLGYFLLWYNFGIEGQWARFVYFLLAYLFFNTVATLALVPYEALLPRMVKDYNERTKYASARSFLAGVSGAWSIWIYEALIHVSTAADYPGQTKNFALLGFVLGGIFAVSPVITFFGSKETQQPSPPKPMNARGLVREYKDLLRSRLYRRSLFLNLLGMFVAYAGTGSSVIFVLMTYGNRDFTLHFGKFALPLSLIFFTINFESACNVLSFILNVFLMQKRSKKAAMLVNLPILTVSSLIFLFTTKSTPLWIYFIGLFCSGLGASCLAFVPGAMTPDLPDVDELIFGRRREGVGAGLLSLGKKCVQGLSFLIFGAVLSAFGLSEDAASPENATFAALAAVKMMLCVIPLLGYAILFFATRKYNLDTARHGMLQAKIAQKRASGKAEFSPEEIAVCEDVTGLAFEELWIARPLTEEEISASAII